MTILRGENFTYNSEKKLIIGDSSTIGMREFPSVIVIRSHRTGKQVFFAHIETVKGIEDAPDMFVYEPMTSGLNGWQVNIYKDQ